MKKVLGFILFLIMVPVMAFAAETYKVGQTLGYPGAKMICWGSDNDDMYRISGYKIIFVKPGVVRLNALVKYDGDFIPVEKTIIVSGQAMGLAEMGQHMNANKTAGYVISPQNPMLVYYSDFTTLPDEVIMFANNERAHLGLPLLQKDDELEKAAEVRAREIVQQLSHIRPDGSSYETAFPLQRLYTKREELFLAGSGNAYHTVRQWRKKAADFRNLYDPNVRKVGVGFYYNIETEHKYYTVMLLEG